MGGKWNPDGFWTITCIKKGENNFSPFSFIVEDLFFFLFCCTFTIFKLWIKVLIIWVIGMSVTKSVIVARFFDCLIIFIDKLIKWFDCTLCEWCEFVKCWINESKELKAIKAENRELKKAVIELLKNLNEAYITNVNRGKITKLFLENTTSKSEKVDIVNRFSKEANTVEKSQALYESINRELKKNNKSSATLLKRMASPRKNLIIVPTLATNAWKKVPPLSRCPRLTTKKP